MPPVRALCTAVLINEWRVTLCDDCTERAEASADMEGGVLTDRLIAILVGDF